MSDLFRHPVKVRIVALDPPAYAGMTGLNFSEYFVTPDLFRHPVKE
jgi:hypothetical protein